MFMWLRTLCCTASSAGACAIGSCRAPQVLEFGLYEFVRQEGNPGGVRKIKKGTEVRPDQTQHPLHATWLPQHASVRGALLLSAW